MPEAGWHTKSCRGAEALRVAGQPLAEELQHFRHATPGSVFTCRRVRREALLIRVEVGDLHRLPVAAGGWSWGQPDPGWCR
jgi:hypothetical protein